MKFIYPLGAPYFTVRDIDIQNVSRDKGYRHSYKNGRGKHGFIYTVSGAMCDTFTAPVKDTVTVGAGELIFIPAGTVYTGTYLDEGTEIKIVQFELESGALPPYLSVPRKMDLPNGGALIEAFFAPLENRVSSHPFYHLSRLYELLWQVDQSYTRVPTKYRRLQAALFEISEDWAQSKPVSHYAALCDMSEVSFRRLFCEYTGLSPIAYRNDLRLKYARVKLQSGEFNVSEAATACGFTNLSFFIRLYKKKYGHTPKKE